MLLWSCVFDYNAFKEQYIIQIGLESIFNSIYVCLYISCGQYAGRKYKSNIDINGANRIRFIYSSYMYVFIARFVCVTDDEFFIRSYKVQTLFRRLQKRSEDGTQTGRGLVVRVKKITVIDMQSLY